MTLDATVLPALLLLAAELLALSTVGYVVARVALRQSDDRMALAQGLAIGPALWGLIANFVMYLVPGRAGALLGWLIVSALGAVLLWRSETSIRPRWKTVLGLAIAGSLVFSISLAARQLHWIVDSHIHLGLSALTQAGHWPLALPWSPDQPFIYHYGFDMLVGLLSPSDSLSMAFTTELLGAYVWTALALTVATSLLSRLGWIGVLTIVPLLLSPGAWTLLIGSSIPDILTIPTFTDIPSPGLRASLASIYFPDASLDWRNASEASPPNIWKPAFVMAYTLALIVLMYVAHRRSCSLSAALTIASLIAFLGLLSVEIALFVLGTWVAIELLYPLWGMTFPIKNSNSLLLTITNPIARRNHPHRAPNHNVSNQYSTIAHIVSRMTLSHHLLSTRVPSVVIGTAIAMLLLAVAGGPLTAIFRELIGPGLSFRWIDFSAARQLLGTLVAPPTAGVTTIGLGIVPVSIFAIILAWRSRLVSALIVGSAIFALAGLVIHYAPSPHDVLRFDGHARNLGLLALMFALAMRLRSLDGLLRYASGVAIVALVTWPTTVVPVRTLALGIGNGIQLSNPQEALQKPARQGGVDPSNIEIRRHVDPKPVSDQVREYIRSETRLDARILSPNWDSLTSLTGRLNASGFVRYSHLTPATGPEYIDAIFYLDPRALRSLQMTHVHATDSWISQLPTQARRWLSDPSLFELLVQGEFDSLYRIRPAFLDLNPDPDSRSYEALRRAIPANAAVRVIGLTDVVSARVASTLAHTILLGFFPRGDLHLRTEIPSQSPNSALADFVVVPRDRPHPYDLQTIRPVWWNQSAIAYAAESSDTPTIDPPPQPDAEFSVRLSETQQTEDRISFRATFTDHSPTAWTGQDWLLISGRDLPWALPTEDNGITIASLAWFAGQIAPGGVSTHVYEFDARQNRLAVKEADGRFAGIQSFGDRLAPGTYVLAVRLRYEYLQAAIIPVMRIAIADSGRPDYTLYAGSHETHVSPCPERLSFTESCRRLAPLS